MSPAPKLRPRRCREEEDEEEDEEDRGTPADVLPLTLPPTRPPTAGKETVRSRRLPSLPSSLPSPPAAELS